MASLQAEVGGDVSKSQDASVAKAKKAIGQPEGLAVLVVFFCERATGLGSDVGLQDEGCFEALAACRTTPCKMPYRPRILRA